MYPEAIRNTEVFQNLLKKLEAFIKCSICKEKFTKPVRIKTCGHSFCQDCLKSSKQDHNCPICDTFYELQHLDFDHICESVYDELAELREIIDSVAVIRTSIGVSKKNKDDTKPHKKSDEKKLKINERLVKNTPAKTNKKIAEQNGNNFDEEIADSLLEANKNSIIIYKNNKYQINYLKNKSKINAKGETPLHTACRSKPSENKFIKVKDLIESRVDLNAKDFAGWAPIHEATDVQDLQIVEYLLKSHCLVNIPGCDYSTPLHQAVSQGNVKLVKILLKYGASKDMIDYYGRKPENYTDNQEILDVMRQRDEVIETSISQLFLWDNIQIYCHSLNENIKEKLVEANNIIVRDQMGKKNLTHFAIKKTHKMSFKILQAMLEGLQFITEESVDDYIRGQYFINIPEYIFLQNDQNLNEGIRKAMLSALLKLPRLFEGINFYVEDHTEPVAVYNLKADKEYLQKLIQAGGGRILMRPPATRTCESELRHPFFARANSKTFRCCNFIIFGEDHPPELMYRMDELQHKSSKWLIDCVVQYEILE